MLRLLLLPLFLFTLSMACMTHGQTFQYSRGWTNGKRASLSSPLLNNGQHFHRSNDVSFADFYDFPATISERRLERCLTQLQHFVGNSLLHRSFATGLDSDSSDAPSSNNENSPYTNPKRRHQSNDLFEELNAVVGSVPAAGSGEPNDFIKH
ncbi:pro-corazonin [Drosophila tropicalis]|uniref:pro-corazonin n=1 Tax=Drosophila tropicalis TaxID=46794 RepID=UPI0035ABEA4B